MIDRDAGLARWRRAFGDEAGGELREGDLAAIQVALAGELGRGALGDLVDRLAEEPALARAWRLGRALRSELGPATTPEVARTGAPRWGWAAAAAAAAALLVVVTRPPDAPHERAPASEAVVSELAEGAALSRAAFELRWRAEIPGARYTVEVVDADLHRLARASNLADRRYRVPPEALAGVSSGGSVLWRVEALAPSGERYSSPAFVQRLE